MHLFSRCSTAVLPLALEVEIDLPLTGIAVAVLTLLGAHAVRNTAAAEAARNAPSAGVQVYDANSASAAVQPGSALLSRTGWTQVAEDEITHTFKGDAVLMNDRIACVLRRGASGIEIYSMQPKEPVMRSLLSPLNEAGTALLSSVRVVENSAESATAEAGFVGSSGQRLVLRCELRAGGPVVQTEAREGVSQLRVGAPCRFAVLPDFFADDIVIDAAELPLASDELPADNIVLRLMPDHDAAVVTVAPSADDDIRVGLAGEGAVRTINHSDLRYGKEGRIWVAVLAGPAIWHMREIVREDAGHILALDWKAPFPAQWRTDWRREDDLTDSWDMLAENRDGRFTKPGLYSGPEIIPADRKRWTTVLGEFNYPCWIDRNGHGYLQPLRRPTLRLEGPAVIYPLNRARTTPLDAFTVVDVLRNTLGVGPCEYILDLEGQRSQYKGRATCSVRDTLNPIYSQKQQKERRADIERTLRELIVFVRHIRSRIEGYVRFGHDMRNYLAEQQRVHPELSHPLSELDNIARSIDERFAARKDNIQTPDAVVAMVQEFRQTVLDDQSDDALAKCRRFTEGWVKIGGNQDELVGECRWAVKMLRQRAGLLMAADPRLADIAREIRQRSQIVLRNPAVHEGARH
jgi:hypothetical protein